MSNSISTRSPLAIFVAACEPTILDRIDIPPRPERREAPPEDYASGLIHRWLTLMAGASTIWSHQARALEKISAGHNVVIATATASGKTLPFQAAAVRELLTGQGTILVLVPQKALSGDQLVRWQAAMMAAGLPASLVREVNGHVPTCQREELLDGAGVLLCTPDVVHSWMLRQSDAPLVREFLRRLRYLVIDEAHTLEGVFGSNCAYLFRRLRSLVDRVKSAVANPVEPLQIIAATATIADPVGHMAKLTGLDFELVDETENGAPTHGITLLHIEGPAHGAPAEKMLATTISSLAAEAAPAALIAFADKRQGVERITRLIDRDDVLPYRGGYDPQDRKDIEQALRDRELRGVVSTSALELGIDVPQFRFGFNLGVPMSLKAARQRVGRVGRTSEGVFAFVAPATAFSRFGSTFREFYEGEIEASHLYLENRLIQFQQACCLREECSTDDGEAVLPDNVDWPEGFVEAFALAAPGARKPSDIERIAMLGTGTPHLDYPLRHIAEPEYALRLPRGGGDPIGQIPKDKAMREAFPGSTYMHMRRSYRVLGWKTTGYENTITLLPIKGSEQPKPMFETTVNVSHDPLDVIDQHLLHGSQGSIAETCMRVVESVYGYTVGGKPMPYRELSKSDSRMSTKRREFGTTGIVIRINEPWFKGSGETQMAARRAIAKVLAEMLAHDRSIATADVSWAHTGISLHTRSGPSKLDDAIVVFDNVQGGLRLTSPLFAELSALIERLGRAVALSGPEALLSVDTVARLAEWHATLGAAGEPTVDLEIVHDADECIIYAEGSLVQVRTRNSLEERRLLSHQIFEAAGTKQVMYQYESAPGVSAWVPHDMIEPVGDGWRYVLWNMRTNAIREIAA
jgi:DEAD/DEAH box helicase domain-containing protein